MGFSDYLETVLLPSIDTNETLTTPYNRTQFLDGRSQPLYEWLESILPNITCSFILVVEPIRERLDHWQEIRLPIGIVLKFSFPQQNAKENFPKHDITALPSQYQ